MGWGLMYEGHGDGDDWDDGGDGDDWGWNQSS